MINKGISFGWEIPGLLGVVLVAWMGLIIFNLKEKSAGLWVTIIGGGWNLTERLLMGGVKDYWKIPGTNIYNNLADWLIFIGIGWYLWQKIRSK